MKVLTADGNALCDQTNAVVLFGGPMRADRPSREKLFDKSRPMTVHRLRRHYRKLSRDDIVQRLMLRTRLARKWDAYSLLWPIERTT